MRILRDETLIILWAIQGFLTEYTKMRELKLKTSKLYPIKEVLTNATVIIHKTRSVIKQVNIRFIKLYYKMEQMD